MKAKYIFQNIASLTALFLTGISASAATERYFYDTIKFVNDADLPENPTAYLMGGFFGEVFGIMFTILIVFILLIWIFYLRKKIRLSLLLFQKGESIACRVWRIIGYLLILRSIYHGVNDYIKYKEFFINGLWYYSSIVAFISMFIIIFESIITKDKVLEQE